MTDQELIEGLCLILDSDAEHTENESKFLLTIARKNLHGQFTLTEKQRAWAEDILRRMELEGSGPVRIIPPPGAEKYLRKRKAWEV